MIAGVDEAGRGPLIGSVFAAAVILPTDYHLPYLTDSKKLTEKRRDILAVQIKEQAVAWAVASSDNQLIFKLNILHATMDAMRRAILALDIAPKEVLVDGNRLPPNLPYPARAIIGGDAQIAAISAASILAKTARDAQMYQLHKKYPQYNFDRHKGYGTAVHLAAIEQYGILPEHRRDFAPIKKWLVAHPEY